MAYGIEVESGVLYRYRPYRPDELRLLLAAGQIRFSDANHFNDPCDCRPLIRKPFENDAAENARWIDWIVDKKIKHGMIGRLELSRKKNSRKTHRAYRLKLRLEVLE